jgi:thiosulfate dehydrogenase [quinone] large subunit
MMIIYAVYLLHMTNKKTTIFTVLRLTQGWIFLWAFFDKVFGWGYATKPAQAWINGGSPTAGFLSHAPNALVHSLSGQLWVDWLFMLGLLGLGLTLILGIGLKVAAVSGFFLMVLMWLALLPLVNNPFIDEHIVYALLFLIWPQITETPTWWRRSMLVKSLPWLA